MKSRHYDLLCWIVAGGFCAGILLAVIALMIFLASILVQAVRPASESCAYLALYVSCVAFVLSIPLWFVRKK